MRITTICKIIGAITGLLLLFIIKAIVQDNTPYDSGTFYSDLIIDFIFIGLGLGIGQSIGKYIENKKKKH